MSFLKKMADIIHDQCDKISKTTIICSVNFIFWFSKIINRIVDFFVDIYNEYDCIKDAVDGTAYITTYTCNSMTKCKCEPLSNNWISSNVADMKGTPPEFFDTYTVLNNFEVYQLHNYFITFLNNKQPLESNELIILKGYDRIYKTPFYICQRPSAQIRTEYKIIYSDVHFLSVNYKHPEMSESISLPIGKEWCVVGNDILDYTHVLRMLNYQSSNYVFNVDYVLEIIDSNIKIFELHSYEFIRIRENCYSVEKGETESDKDSSEPIEF